jgi:RNA-directed DNA polymerase
MSELKKLKSAVTLHDVAELLGFKPKALSFILYKKPIEEKYRSFEIPKRTGGLRKISAPSAELMKLQRRLAKFLQNCIVEINKDREITSSLSHGFKPKHSIITNAINHRNRRFVFNLDLEDFFGTINFGRVRGFFISNRNFELNPTVATILAQIICHENKLPQGGPSSPIISNLIGHLLDIRLAKLAEQTGCSYSRYADDLTFSTNQRDFPVKIAKRIPGDLHQWQIGTDLSNIIQRTGFAINAAKTRMQYEKSRQEVTGLVVNKKVQTPAEYRHMARTMVYRLIKTGAFQRKNVSRDKQGNKLVVEVPGTLEQLNGILSFIDSINVFEQKKDMKPTDKEKPLKAPDKFNGGEKVYRSFLFYKNFYANSMPLIICEGKTDNVYIKCAIKNLAERCPLLVEKAENGLKAKIKFFRRSNTTDRLLGLSGGSDQIITLIKEYIAGKKHVAGTGRPVILLIDNDEGARGIYNYVSKITKTASREAPYICVEKDLYIVATPLTANGKDTMIEDFFDTAWTATELNGKTFNPSNDPKHFDNKKHYGKAYFSEHVIKKNEAKINFDKFLPLLQRIELVMQHHAKNRTEKK